MKKINKNILIIFILALMFLQNVIYANMADYTDEQADQNLKQEQEKWQKEQEERINKSSNNYLKNLKVEGYEISPSFDKQTINYEIKQEVTEAYLNINAETDDEKASVSGVGKIILNSGENNLKINVIAENGTERTYFVKVLKKVKKDIRLKSLNLKTDNSDSIQITPEFDGNIFTYNCKVPNYINKINIDTIASDENASIKVEGNENLKEGLNEILIVVSLEEEITYKINVYKEKINQEQEKIKQEKIEYKNVIIIIIVFIIIFIIIVFNIIKRIKKK